MSYAQGSKGQLTSKTDAHTGKPLPEGYVVLVTSAGNGLAFHSPAEAELYRASHASQIKTGGRDDRVPLTI